MAANDRNGGDLSSWKEISDFLGVSERTAQKWEAERGLPVERLSGQKGRVAAKVAALENWKKSNLRKTPWYASVRALQYYGLVVSAVMLTVLGLLLLQYIRAHEAGLPARYRLEFNTLITEDTSGKEAWRYVFKAPLAVGVYSSETDWTEQRMSWFGKLGSEDSEPSMLFVYYPVTSRTTGTALVCFSGKGSTKWEFKPGKEVRDANTSYQPAFTVTRFQVTPLTANAGKEQPNRILVTSHHYRDYPTQFAILDENGKLESEYWHSGFFTHLETADLNHDGIREILLAGIDNGRKAATLVVLDPRRVGGASEQPPGDEHQLQGMAAGTEICVILFPKTCLSEQFNYSAGLRISEDTVEVETCEREADASISILYQFDHNLNLKNVSPSTHLINLHHALHVKGELNHEWSREEEAKLHILRWVKGHPNPWSSVGMP